MHNSSCLSKVKPSVFTILKKGGKMHMITFIIDIVFLPKALQIQYDFHGTAAIFLSSELT